jgi:hypothetical protein
MNERILSPQLLKLVQAAGPEHSSVNPQWVKNFVELIVKEYEKLLPEICPWDQAGKEGPMKGWHVQFVARKHFGIE